MPGPRPKPRGSVRRNIAAHAYPFSQESVAARFCGKLLMLSRDEVVRFADTKATRRYEPGLKGLGWAGATHSQHVEERGAHNNNV